MNQPNITTDKTILFGTAFYHSPGKAPNGWTLSERAKFDMYYRCMVVCYASVRRFYPDARLVLYSNRELPEPFNTQLAALDVITEACGERYVNDPAFSNNFPGCLYTLDVIDALARSAPVGIDTVVLMDSDCVMRTRIGASAAISQGAGMVYAYEPGYPTNMLANGQSRASLTLALSYFLNRLVAEPISFYGGEFLATPMTLLPRLATNIECFWDWMKARGIGIVGSQITEEHVLSVALADPNIQVQCAMDDVKRIWTADAFSTVDGTESEIPIWHLPSEKKKGFRVLYRYCQRHGGFKHLSNSDFLALVDEAFPLQRRSRQYPGKNMKIRLRSAARLLLAGRW